MAAQGRGSSRASSASSFNLDALPASPSWPAALPPSRRRPEVPTRPSPRPKPTPTRLVSPVASKAAIAALPKKPDSAPPRLSKTLHSPAAGSTSVEDSLCHSETLSDTCEWHSDVSSGTLLSFEASGRVPVAIRPEPARLACCAASPPSPSVAATSKAPVSPPPRAAEPAPSADLHHAQGFVLAAAAFVLVVLGLCTGEMRIGVVAALVLGLLIAIAALTCQGARRFWRRVSEALRLASQELPLESRLVVPRTVQL